MADDKNNTNFTKFGYGINVSHEENLDYEGVAPRSLIYQQGSLQSSYRFFLRIRGIDVAYIVNVSRPSYTIATETNKILNWTFQYPTRITWEPINFTVREIFEGYNQQTILGLLYKKLTDYAWNPPNFSSTLGGPDKDLSKLSLKESLGEVKIRSIDANGNDVEIWTLHGAFITSVKPSQLNYEQDNLTQIDVTVHYDYATLEVANGSATY